MRVANTVVLTEEERTMLTKLSRGRSTQARVVLRAKIVLAAADGRRNDHIAGELGCTRRTVSTWRNRFVTARVSGIVKDAPRGGRTPAVRAVKEAEILRKTTQETPGNATHWSTRTMAKAVGVSKATVQCMQKHRHQEWLKFLKKIDAETPADLDLHLIVDNYATHKHPNVQKWLKRHKRFHVHFTPTSSSWLNLVERWFRDITQQRIRRGVFKSIAQLEQAISDYIAHHNANPKGFVWVAKAEDILEKVRRARKTLDKLPSA